MSVRWGVVHPGFGPRGGGELVGAWVMQALASEGEVTLVTEKRVDWRAIDAAFGTELASHWPKLAVKLLPLRDRALLRILPGRGHRIRRALLERFARAIAVQDGIERWISTCDEMRLPYPGAQYVHWPRSPQRTERILWQRIPGAVRVHDALARWLGTGAPFGERDNVSWVNSRFTAEAWKRIYASSCTVLYPPVPELVRGDALRPWAERRDRVVCVGRLFWGKGLERVLRIVNAVRQNGVALELVLAGRWDCGARERRAIERQARAAGAELQVGVTRTELGTLLATSRYGLHGMECEPFGIAVAEMQDAGMIVLAPDTGGPPEILGDGRQLYHDEVDAVEKLGQLVRDETLQRELHARALSRRGLFAPERFVAQLRRSLAEAGPCAS